MKINIFTHNKKLLINNMLIKCTKTLIPQNYNTKLKFNKHIFGKKMNQNSNELKIFSDNKCMIRNNF